MTTGSEPRLAVLSATVPETLPLAGGRLGASTRPAWPVVGAGEVSGVSVLFAVSGVGKAAAAAAVAALRLGWEVRAVLQAGIGGAYPGSGIGPGAAALARSETDLDLGEGRHPDWRGLEALNVPGERARNVIALEGAALRAAADATGLPALPFATSDSVTADMDRAAYVRRRFGVDVESMEGAGAARAASLLGVAFVEVRGVSNLVGERDRSAWRVQEAIAAACEAAASALPAIREVVS